MASINILRGFVRGATTHEGATASRITPEQQLRRLVMSCMLWEDEFYVNGRTIAEQIREAVGQVDPATAASIAIQARDESKLRHVPLWIVREMARLATHKPLVAATLERVIQRPDEITEFIAIYWKDGRCPLSAQVKRGLAAAFRKFDEYQLAKYDRDGAVRLRDVLFLVHAAPADRTVRYTKAERSAGVSAPTPGAELFSRITERTLATPDTWEVALSAGADKRATFERMIAERKLGALALLRNLRNMEGAGVPKDLVREALAAMRTDRVLPFRFIAAARAVPAWEDIIEPPMLGLLEDTARLSGRTGVLVDVSGSMDARISRRSDLSRIDAACALAVLVREIAEDAVIASFSNSMVTVAPRRGFALRDAIVSSQPHSATYLGQAVRQFAAKRMDRMIIITDEQSHDEVVLPQNVRSYLINVASAKNGVAYGQGIHIDGWSESVIDFIRQVETLDG